MNRLAHALPAVALAMALSLPAMARPGGAWGAPGWGRDALGGSAGGWERDARAASRAREGKVQVARFTAEGDAAQALGHGRIAVSADAAEPGDPRERATYEAAVVDALAAAGYDTATPDPQGGQIAELRITHDVIMPQEAPRKPVSGQMAMGVSNRGSMMGMAVNVDMTKPLKALVNTRLSARIVDRASGKPLWEGRADIATREGDPDWTDQAVATRLARALFDGFPGKTGPAVALR